MRISELRVGEVREQVAALRPPAAKDREVADTVSRLLADVRARGDTAVVEATARFDWPAATAAALPVPAAELEAAFAEVAPSLLSALETARANLTLFHQQELRRDWEVKGPQGQILGVRLRPVARAGLYVPGGLGAYASTVLMNAVPAQVAGVKELVLCTPPGRDGAVNRSVLATARLLGITRVFRVGGAQAIAAMAFGTETIPRVDVICGPGNAYVMEAKRQVYGVVGIDSLAGPSEVLILADRTARPAWVAVDLLAQEEHGSGAQAVLLGETRELCEAVAAAAGDLRNAAVSGRGRSETTPAGVGAGGAAESAGGVGGEVAGEVAGEEDLHAFYPASGEDFVDLASALVEAYAPEHLEVQVADARALLPRLGPAGAVFLGHWAPTAFGDYVAGSNHVLPTGGAARFSSPLSVDVFTRKSSYVELSAEAAARLTGPLADLARAEGFAFHRLSAELRLRAAERREGDG